MGEKKYKEILEYFLHEVVQLNANIKTHTEILSKTINDKNSIIHHSEMINENSAILSVLIDIVNFRLNPEFFSLMKKDLRNLHGKFHKVFISLKNSMKQKGIKYRLNCDIERLINLFPIIDTLPYLLIDNAIKYSPKNGEIIVTLSDFKHSIRIEIENLGPKIYDDELDKLFDKSFRGKNAIETGIIGSGLGLNFIQNICELHGGTVSVECGKNIYHLNGIEYQSFKVIIDLPEE